MSLKLNDLPAFVAEVKANLAAGSAAVKAQLEKASAELIAKINALINTNPDLPGDTVAQLEELRAAAALPELRVTAQGLDDIVPDPAVEPPAEPPVEPPVVEEPPVVDPVDPIDPANPPE